MRHFLFTITALLLLDNSCNASETTFAASCDGKYYADLSGNCHGKRHIHVQERPGKYPLIEFFGHTGKTALLDLEKTANSNIAFPFSSMLENYRTIIIPDAAKYLFIAPAEIEAVNFTIGLLTRPQTMPVKTES